MICKLWNWKMSYVEARDIQLNKYNQRILNFTVATSLNLEICPQTTHSSNLSIYFISQLIWLLYGCFAVVIFISSIMAFEQKINKCIDTIYFPKSKRYFCWHIWVLSKIIINEIFKCTIWMSHRSLAFFVWVIISYHGVLFALGSITAIVYLCQWMLSPYTRITIFCFELHSYSLANIGRMWIYRHSMYTYISILWAFLVFFIANKQWRNSW